jgi:hypothetical protein
VYGSFLGDPYDFFMVFEGLFPKNTPVRERETEMVREKER